MSLFEFLKLSIFIDTAVAIFCMSMNLLDIVGALCGVGSKWKVGFDGADWWNGRAGCYTT
jgi:hypothetical protein